MPTSMTRQHFRAVADAIRETPGLSSEQRARLALTMAGKLYQFNPRFNRDTFVEAATADPDVFRHRIRS